MKFSDLLNQPTQNDFDVQHLTDDSRLVERDSVFVFDERVAQNGEAYIDMALQKGAVAVVTNIKLEKEGVFYSENIAGILAKWATNQFPKMPKHLVAVTGTNGKTSVAWFFKEILTLSGRKAASLGTMGVHIGSEKVADTGFTSPTALKLHPILHDLAKKGVEYVCLEASSHALELGRLAGVDFDAAAFTNLSQDHLDFHGDMESYFSAKAKLFEGLSDKSTAVLNILRQECWPLAAYCKNRELNMLTYGASNAELIVRIVEAKANGLLLMVKLNDAEQQVEVPVIGAFQAENLAGAMGLALAVGVPWGDMVAALPKLKSVPGRMELVSKAGQPTVLVDYAHTDDAIARALESVKPLTKGNLWCVFGAGGDRDATKRSKMGKAAAKFADKVVVTDDNPRSEDPAKIRADIMAAVPSAIEANSRRDAIFETIKNADKNDVIVLAGKGHETGIIMNDEVLPFDDREVAREALAAR